MAAGRDAGWVVMRTDMVGVGIHQGGWNAEYKSPYGCLTGRTREPAACLGLG